MLALNPRLLAVVRVRLEQDWSPEQIAVWLKREHADDPAMRVSHETIYRSTHLADRRELGVKPARHLRSGRSVRHPRGSNENTNRLLRQYLSKGADLRAFSMRDLDDIAERINTRPRRVLDWATAAERFWPQVRTEYVS